MQSFRMLSAIAAGAVLVSGAAYAQSMAYKGEARLLNAASAPREETIAGVAWRCEGDACVGAVAGGEAPLQACSTRKQSSNRRRGSCFTTVTTITLTESNPPDRVNPVQCDLPRA